MKRKFNPILILAAVLIFIGTLVTIYFFNKMNGAAGKISELVPAGSEYIPSFEVLRLNYQLSIGSFLLLQLVSLGALVFAILNGSRVEDKTNKLLSTITEKEDRISELEEELDNVHVQLKNANTMAERTAKFMNLIQKADEIKSLSETIITELSKSLEASQSAFFIATKEDDEDGKEADFMKLISSYAYHVPEGTTIRFKKGEGLVGQVAKDAKTLHLRELPPGHIEVVSGLGSSEKAHLLIVPILSDARVVGIIEIASFVGFVEDDIKFVEQIAQNISTKLSVFVANK